MFVSLQSFLYIYTLPSHCLLTCKVLHRIQIDVNASEVEDHERDELQKHCWGTNDSQPVEHRIQLQGDGFCWHFSNNTVMHFVSM